MFFHIVLGTWMMNYEYDALDSTSRGQSSSMRTEALRNPSKYTVWSWLWTRYSANVLFRYGQQNRKANYGHAVRCLVGSPRIPTLLGGSNR
jgi:hypothetical protein